MPAARSEEAPAHSTNTTALAAPATKRSASQGPTSGNAGIRASDATSASSAPRNAHRDRARPGMANVATAPTR